MDQPLNLQEAIINLQTYLRAISFVDERILRVPIDGIFDSVSENAVASFQRTRGLPDTGIVDKTTWDAIYKEFLELSSLSDRSYGINLFPVAPQNYEAALGEEHAFISLVQFLLSELAVNYDELTDVKISGVFDDRTEKAVKDFQRISMLPVTGRVDLRTYNRLSEDFSNYTRYVK